MLQTLIFKFSAADESVALFTKLAGKKESHLRIGTGILELIASILLFMPKSTWVGAILTLGFMSGAILSHLTSLGINYNNDKGLLFIAAVFVFLVALLVFMNERKNIPKLGGNCNKT
jgi:uncharacterized membrane protein YphA (DoxX/SURF4 family)